MIPLRSKSPTRRAAVLATSLTLALGVLGLGSAQVSSAALGGPTTRSAHATTGTGGVLSNGCAYSARGLPSCGAYVGAAYGSNSNPAKLEQAAGQRLGVHRTYWRADQVSSAVASARADVAAGRLPWISFKLPYSWEDMVAGKGDSWAQGIASQLATIPGPVWVAFHHEPEGDGNVQAWKAMQERLAPMVRAAAANVAYTVILTGYDQLYGPSQYSLANIWPTGVKIDVAGFDPYNEYGVTKSGKTNTTWPHFGPMYFDPISAWAKQHNVAWGIAETGLTDAGTANSPHWMHYADAALVRDGGVAFTYFDTTLNAYGSWAITTSTKEADFADALSKSPLLPTQ